MRHEWQDGDVLLAVDESGHYFRYPDGPWRRAEGSADAYATEILRLAERVKGLEDAATLAGAGLAQAAAAERERIRRLALAGTEWLEPADLIPPRPSSREGDLWRRAQAVARREFAEELEK